ncbi:MAG: SDR family oxidoreductase [Chloroflexia bacterium]|nr:SDR family oxidoreductase [Chloroflexia bacterium]
MKRTAESGTRLAGKTAIVTGAGHGIGLGIASLFAAHGANVVLVSLNETALDEATRSIVAGGGSADFVAADVAEAAAVANVVRRTVEHFGTIDILVNNAGIMPAGTALTTSEETWRRVLDVNLTSIYLFARAVVPVMKNGGRGGSIVNIASVQGLRGHPNRLAYATSKHGVIGVTRALAADHATDRIRVNALCPGTIDTPMLHRELEKVAASERDATLESYRRLHPLGMIGEPRDVAWAALFLASEEARFITGADLPVDGGYTSLIVHE